MASNNKNKISPAAPNVANDSNVLPGILSHREGNAAEASKAYNAHDEMINEE